MLDKGKKEAFAVRNPGKFYKKKKIYQQASGLGFFLNWRKEDEREDFVG